MFASLLALSIACAPVSVGPPGDSLAALYANGQTWVEFLRDARARRTMWTDNYEQAAPSEALVMRARAVGGTWHFLVVAVDSCSDSANTIPYLAALVDRVPGLAMRVVHPREGREIMERHRTDDGRAATPTVLLLDADFIERGCFVERPRALRTWLAEHASLTDEARYESKMTWYQEDRGAETVLDLVTMLEAAATGAPLCDARRP